METLVIDRAQHLTGNAFRHLNHSGLCDQKTGLKCCLGFYGNALHIADSEMTGYAHVTSVCAFLGKQQPSWLSGLIAAQDKIVDSDKTVENALISANDDFLAHPSCREGRIRKLFRKYGNIDVQFVGDRGVATRVARKASNGE